jgi:hypothetical protein
MKTSDQRIFGALQTYSKQVRQAESHLEEMVLFCISADSQASMGSIGDVTNE